MPIKTKACILRLTERDNVLFNSKAHLLGISKSKLLRDGAFYYWNGYNNAQWSDKLREIYQNGDNDTKSFIIDIVFEYYRRTGYPHRDFTNAEIVDQMVKISSSKSPLLPDNNLQVNIVGTTLANYFHPHMMNVRCLQKYLSPMELYKDDDKFKDAIKRWLDLGNKPNHSGMRRILRTRDGTRSVVNFKPVIAKYIYNNYVPKNGKVLDPCAGYGGRLAGLISTGKNLMYHGIDPCPDTMVGNSKLSAFYARQYEPIIKELKWPFQFRFDLGCAEDVMENLPDKSYDLVFTSPPYFDIEKYDTLPNQSYLRYSTYDSWRDNFLSVLVKESCRVAKQYVILNVKNYKNLPIADDTVEFAKQVGWEIYKTYHMRLANSEFHRKKNEQKFHTEPIYIFHCG